MIFKTHGLKSVWLRALTKVLMISSKITIKKGEIRLRGFTMVRINYTRQGDSP